MKEIDNWFTLRAGDWEDLYAKSHTRRAIYVYDIKLLKDCCFHASISWWSKSWFGESENWQQGLPWWLSGKESACQCRRYGFNPWVTKSPWRREWLPTPVFLPEKSPWTEESGGLQFMRSQRIVYDSATKQQPEVAMLLSPPFYKRKNSEAEVTKLVQGC